MVVGADSLRRVKNSYVPNEILGLKHMQLLVRLDIRLGMLFISYFAIKVYGSVRY